MSRLPSTAHDSLCVPHLTRVLVPEHCMSLSKRPSLTVLTGEPHIIVALVEAPAQGGSRWVVKEGVGGVRSLVPAAEVPVA